MVTALLNTKDYFWQMRMLKEVYSDIKDIRLRIIGIYFTQYVIIYVANKYSVRKTLE